MQFFIDAFKGINTPYLWISQISGLIGLVVIFISYLFKKKKFLAIASISFIFFILEQAFAVLISSLIVTCVCFIRNILMLILLLKEEKPLPKWLVYGLIGLMWVGVIIYMCVAHEFNKFDNYLPALIVTMSTITQNFKNEYVVKVGSIFHEGGFLVYFIIQQLPFSIFRQICLVIATTIGLCLIIYKNYKEKKCLVENNLEE